MASSIGHRRNKSKSPSKKIQEIFFNSSLSPFRKTTASKNCITKEKSMIDIIYRGRSSGWSSCHNGIIFALGDFDKSNDDVSIKFSDFWIISMWKDSFRPLHACARLTQFSSCESVCYCFHYFFLIFISWLGIILSTYTNSDFDALVQRGKNKTHDFAQKRKWF